MAELKDLVDKNKLLLYLLIIVAAFLTFSLAHQEPKVSIKPIKESKMTETEKLAKENHDLRDRLARLEPAAPVKIVTADEPSKAIETLPVLAVMSEGTRVPFETVYEDQSWARPDYEPYWHSKQGVWSKVPDRIHSSLHRLFVTPGTEGLWREVTYEAGIAEVADKIKLPVFDDKPENTLTVVALQYQITDVVVLNNQVVLLGVPSRNGMQVLAVNKQELIKSVSGELTTLNNNQEYLFQMVTPDGYEVDYNNAVVNF